LLALAALLPVVVNAFIRERQQQARSKLFLIFRNSTRAQYMFCTDRRPTTGTGNLPSPDFHPLSCSVLHALCSVAYRCSYSFLMNPLLSNSAMKLGSMNSSGLRLRISGFVCAT